MDDERRVAPLEDVPRDGTLLVTVTHDDDEREELILHRLDDGVVAYRNYCQHWTDVRLDKGSGAPIRNGEIVCRKHAATFESDTGYCNFGPCEGAYLDAVDVAVEDGVVYLLDDEYTFEHRGAAEPDDLSGSNSRIGFGG